MSSQTNIEWCDSTFNPWIGCTKVSPACDDCYAARSTPARALGVLWGPKEERHRTSASNWALPKRWEREHEAFFAARGRRRRVFCASLADVFDNAVPADWRTDLLELIEQTPSLDWLLLTKRAGNVEPMVMQALRDLFQRSNREPATWPWANIWLGATVVNQEEADRDIPKLLAVPARVRFLSIEPMLGPIALGLRCENWSDDIVMDPETGARECCRACDFTGIGNNIDWVIVGGESGPKARPMHPDWARSLRDQCAAAGVPMLFKQWGEWCTAKHLPDQTGDSLYTEDLSRLRFPNLAMDASGETSPDAKSLGEVATAVHVHRVGKKAAGRLLDGVEHNGYPPELPR